MARTAPKAPSSAATTLGTIVSFCWETTAGTMPTTNYEVIYDCKTGLPLSGDVDKFESSVLILTKRKTYESGLQDSSDASIVCNWTDAVVDLHDEWLSATYAGYVKEGKRLWICQEIPKVGRRYFTPVTPAPFSLDPLEANTLPNYSINFNIQGDDVVWQQSETGTGTNEYKEKIQSDISGFYKNYNGIPQYNELPASEPEKPGESNESES